METTRREEPRWELEPERAPKLMNGDELIYCEHGRIIYGSPERKAGEGTDCRSHWFRIVKNMGCWFLLVHHGAGEERVRLGYGYRNYPAMFDPLTSDARFWLMWQLLEIYHGGHITGVEETAQRYTTAFVEGRLKKRKLPKQEHVKVWIEPKF